MRSVKLRRAARRVSDRRKAPPPRFPHRAVLCAFESSYFRRKGLESSPTEPVTVRISSPFLPSGTTAVRVLSSTWVNFAGLPGPNDTMVTHPGLPKRSPVIVTFSPALPSSGTTFLTLGPCWVQLAPFAKPGDLAAWAFVLWIPPLAFVTACAGLLFRVFLVCSAARVTPIWQAKTSAVKMPMTRTVPMIFMDASFACSAHPSLPRKTSQSFGENIPHDDQA